jgi:hypothetical protein
MNAIKMIARKFIARQATPAGVVRQRLADRAASLSRAGLDLARVTVANEALLRLAELCYERDAGKLVNIDPATGKIRIPAPMGDHGWQSYGLRYREGRTLRAILWARQTDFRPGRVRPPLFTYDPDTRRWYLNSGDYGSLDAAIWYLRRAAVTVIEWRAAVDNAATDAGK